MTNGDAIEAVKSVNQFLSAQPSASEKISVSSRLAMSFPELLSDGLQIVETRLDHADALTKKFVINPDDVPLHEVILSLEQARLAVDLAVQVRNRLTEGYREIMNMQI